MSYIGAFRGELISDLESRGVLKERRSHRQLNYPKIDIFSGHSVKATLAPLSGIPPPCAQGISSPDMQSLLPVALVRVCRP